MPNHCVVYATMLVFPFLLVRVTNLPFFELVHYQLKIYVCSPLGLLLS